jgi:hypothetical protein
VLSGELLAPRVTTRRSLSMRRVLLPNKEMFQGADSVAVDSSLVVRITASQLDEVGLSPVIQATSLADLLDQVQAAIDVLPQPVLLRTNRDLLKRLQDQLVVL